MTTGLTSVKPDAPKMAVRGNAEGQEEGQPQACPVETHRPAELEAAEPALGSDAALFERRITRPAPDDCVGVKA